jgi:prephenate dehydrogenase
MTEQDQLKSIPDGSRPTIAIVGGGGAMGRLFAQLFCGVAREIQLFDFFGTTPRAANLALTLHDIWNAGVALGRTPTAFGLSPVGAESSRPTWRFVSVDNATDRALLVLDGTLTAAGSNASHIRDESLDEIVRGMPTNPTTGCVVVAGLPLDARSLLPRADITLLAIGFEDQDAYRGAIRSYAPWLRPGSLVVDLGSTKNGPMDAMSLEIPATVGILGAHPLFGPSVTQVTGLIVAAVNSLDGRVQSPWQIWFLEQLTRLRMIVTSTTAVDHDDAMAFVQSLTHFALLAFAYTFVRVDRDPADLLIYRTPVFEPLLYLAARVAYLARNNSDTYRSIQALSTRPEVRREFLVAAREILAAIDEVSDPAHVSTAGSDDALTRLFREFGEPWSPDGRERRERQRREHFLEMGVHLVDQLNQLRQDVVSAVGQVRAVEERRGGLPPRVVVGVVDVDLLDPGKYDVTTQIRLRRLNLPLGSVRRDRTGAGRRAPDDGHDEIVPLSRARILTDPELLDWLHRTDQLVERRALGLLTPSWFDAPTLIRLIGGLNDRNWGVGSQVLHVDVSDGDASWSAPPGQKAAVVTLTIVVHPAELLAIRDELRREHDRLTPSMLERVERDLLDVRVRLASPDLRDDPKDLLAQKDRLKHERKALVDRRTADIDRDVRRATRARVQGIADAALAWLISHGCSLPSRGGANSAVTQPFPGSAPAILSGHNDEAR